MSGPALYHVDYFSHLGHQPVSSRHNDLWGLLHQILSSVSDLIAWHEGSHIGASKIAGANMRRPIAGPETFLGGRGQKLLDPTVPLSAGKEKIGLEDLWAAHFHKLLEYRLDGASPSSLTQLAGNPPFRALSTVIATDLLPLAYHLCLSRMAALSTCWSGQHLQKTPKEKGLAWKSIVFSLLWCLVWFVLHENTVMTYISWAPLTSYRYWFTSIQACAA